MCSNPEPFSPSDFSHRVFETKSHVNRFRRLTFLPKNQKKNEYKKNLASPLKIQKTEKKQKKKNKKEQRKLKNRQRKPKTKDKSTLMFFNFFCEAQAMLFWEKHMLCFSHKQSYASLGSTTVLLPFFTEAHHVLLAKSQLCFSLFGKQNYAFCGST